MSNDDCSHGNNGCHALQEAQKVMVEYNTEKNDMKENIVDNKKNIKDINKLLFKQASLIGGITVLIQIVFKFWN